MSNSLPRFTLKENFFGKAVLVANTSRAQVGGRNTGTKVKYPVTTQTVGLAEIYVTEARRAEEVEIGEEVTFGQIVIQPSIRSIDEDNQSTFLTFTPLASSAKKGDAVDPVAFVKGRSDDFTSSFRTGNGNISSMIDIEKTFGDFILISVEPKIFRDAEGQPTGEIEKFVIQARSTLNNEMYSIDVLNLDSNVRELPLFTHFQLSGTVSATLYRDQSQVENIRVSLSLKADDVKAVTPSSSPKAEPVKAEAPKQPENGNNNQKGNQNK
ncbi:hypothetical protein [Lactococcus protaetiae]|uniref:Uncharacterized protein n=1 Tax=Lactococcus protaetiae TaxID=2592653 RepID=A0A514Z6J1_9LACT|nr:hypothetical protein [Lactococcus protaetiae]QDK70173.1 hypothetical protein FLP15_01990 [Lactococcus protaetiae]